MRGQRHARSLFTPGKDQVPIVQEAGWAPGPVWKGAEHLAPTGIRSPDRPARWQSLYRLSYPAHRILVPIFKLLNNGLCWRGQKNQCEIQKHFCTGYGSTKQKVSENNSQPPQSGHVHYNFPSSPLAISDYDIGELPVQYVNGPLRADTWTVPTVVTSRGPFIIKHIEVELKLYIVFRTLDEGSNSSWFYRDSPGFMVFKDRWPCVLQNSARNAKCQVFISVIKIWISWQCLPTVWHQHSGRTHIQQWESHRPATNRKD